MGVRRGQKDGHGHPRLPYPYLVCWQGVPAVTVSLGCDIGMGWLSFRRASNPPAEGDAITEPFW